MIDLSYTRAALLTEIKADAASAGPWLESTDPRVATTEARVRVVGQSREDLFPLLKLALLERFAALPRRSLIHDLLIPLRNALGNACKHGNGGDPAKRVSVELVLTRAGVVMAVTDEGPGFDAAHTFRRFQEEENYYVNHGTGFRNLHRAASLVSYENGGRTVLLCYQPTRPVPEQFFRPAPSAPEPGRTELPVGSTGTRVAMRERVSEPRQLGSYEERGFTDKLAEDSLPKVLDPAWIQCCLSAECPEFVQGQIRKESCRVYAADGPAGDGCGHRYVLRVVARNGEPAASRILTGRLHATEAAAAADFEAATRLHQAAISKSVLIPRPLARLAAEPRLVLYEFDPWMNLWEYLTYRGSLKSMQHRSERIGRFLGRLHRSPVEFDGASPNVMTEDLEAWVARVTARLQTMPGGAKLGAAFRACVDRIPERPALRGQRLRTPSHGALGFDCIHYGVDGRFYLYRFERSGRGDPGLDLGGFAADLLTFMVANQSAASYPACRDVFLTHYNAEVEDRMDEDDLRFYTALALGDRLGRAEIHGKNQVEARLAAFNWLVGPNLKLDSL